MPRKSAKPPSRAGRVGKGSPPKHRQFKKGQSGNPNGRPKGAKNVATLIRQAAEGTVVATIGGQQRKITRIEATALQLATKAAGGDSKAMVKFLDWMDEVERRAAAARPAEFPFSDADLEVLKQVHARMTLCQPPERKTR